MRTVKYILILLLSIKGFSQNKPVIFYNEMGELIPQEVFLQTRDYSSNLDVYYENDSVYYGLLVKRQKFGTLDKSTFDELKSYLNTLSGTRIDSTQNIVINYLTALPKKENNTKGRSTWNIFHRNYLKKLHKIADIAQFWIHSPESDNLEYFHHKRINWMSDKDNLFKKLFFPHEVRYGNYILIRPDGRFFSYLGEHGKDEILENSRKYFK